MKSIAEIDILERAHSLGAKIRDKYARFAWALPKFNCNGLKEVISIWL